MHIIIIYRLVGRYIYVWVYLYIYILCFQHEASGDGGCMNYIYYITYYIYILIMFAIRVVEVLVCGGVVMNGSGGSLQANEKYSVRERILMKLICVVFREKESEYEWKGAKKTRPFTVYRVYRRIYTTEMHIAVAFAERRPFALLPPSRRPFLISGTAGNFSEHTPPPSQVFRAFVYIFEYIYIYDTLLHYTITIYL